MCYLVPRGVAVLWAGLALGWSWSFTVCQPGLGIAPRVRLGGLGNKQEGGGGKQGESSEGAERKGKREMGKQGGKPAAQRSVVYWASDDEYKHRTELGKSPIGLLQ